MTSRSNEDTAAVAAEHRRVVDEHEVIATAIRYTWALDSKDWDALDQVFTTDATANFMGTEHAGRAAIKERISGSLGRMDGSHHIVSNHEVTLDGDIARHRCYLQAQHIRNEVDGSPLYIVAGRYEDDMIRTDAGWRITHRTLIMMWSEGNHAVIRR